MSGQLIRYLGLVILCLMLSFSVVLAEPESGSKSRKFEAVGPTEPVKMEAAEFGERKKASVEVYFDLLPTSMRFYLPSFPCMVTENNIQYSNFWAETYEPRIGGGSFETLQDRSNRYARMWIESQNDARIIVRVRGALCDRAGNIAHTDVPSGSPYGKGDWVDEWYYIYPDGVYIYGSSSNWHAGSPAYGRYRNRSTNAYQDGWWALRNHYPRRDKQDHLLQAIPRGLRRFPGCQYHGCQSQVEVQTVHDCPALWSQDTALYARG